MTVTPTTKRDAPPAFAFHAEAPIPRPRTDADSLPSSTGDVQCHFGLYPAGLPLSLVPSAVAPSVPGTSPMGLPAAGAAVLSPMRGLGPGPVDLTWPRESGSGRSGGEEDPPGRAAAGRGGPLGAPIDRDLPPRDCAAHAHPGTSLDLPVPGPAAKGTAAANVPQPGPPAAAAAPATSGLSPAAWAPIATYGHLPPVGQFVQGPDGSVYLAVFGAHLTQQAPQPAQSQPPPPLPPPPTLTGDYGWPPGLHFSVAGSPYAYDPQAAVGPGGLGLPQPPPQPPAPSGNAIASAGPSNSLGPDASGSDSRPSPGPGQVASAPLYPPCTFPSPFADFEEVRGLYTGRYTPLLLAPPQQIQSSPFGHAAAATSLSAGNLSSDSLHGRVWQPATMPLSLQVPRPTAPTAVRITGTAVENLESDKMPMAPLPLPLPLPAAQPPAPKRQKVSARAAAGRGKSGSKSKA